MLSKEILGYLQAGRQRHLAELLEVLKYPSISGQSQRDADSLACAEHILAALRQLGFEGQLHPWRRHPILIARRNSRRPGAPTVLLYGHYDVQPVDPLNLWDSPPFEPTVRDGAVYARGSSDDKGQLFCQIKALEALLAVEGDLPVNVILLAEGEEEVGSPEVEKFLTEKASLLHARCAIISDSSFFARGLPSITYGLRGLAYVELTLEGPRADLHSGMHGGVVINPLNALARMLAGMHDDQGRVTLPGFYDDVRPLEAMEREFWRRLPFDEGQYAQELGTELAGGEKGVDVLVRRWARPTLDCNGITGGYQGEGAKTVIPAKASAKISMRLVSDQRPEKIVEGFRQYVLANTPPGLRANVAVHSMARPVMIPLDSPYMQTAQQALKEAFGKDPVLVREGASVPITELFQRILHVEPLLVGFGLPDDNLHSPNEHFHLEQYYGGIVAIAAALKNLGEIR
jgi:acetylornithine deacetylase/succinyl-diaminopimelate desuccinylase-like protein